MAKVVEFRIRGDDPSLTKMKAMLDGIVMQSGDRTLQIGEVKVLTVTTERYDVFEILTRLAKLNQTAAAPKKYNRSPKLDEELSKEE